MSFQKFVRNLFPAYLNGGKENILKNKTIYFPPYGAF